MVLWLNGPFGGGKTTTANLVVVQTSFRLFDPEHVGHLVGGHFRDMEFDDFQDLPPWRSLVPKVMAEAEAAAKDWRLEHIEHFNTALEWLEPAADLIIDTTDLQPAEVAARIADVVR